jgi:hypothetical protein
LAFEDGPLAPGWGFCPARLWVRCVGASLSLLRAPSLILLSWSIYIRDAPTAAAGEGSPRWARRGALRAHAVGAALLLSASLVSSSRSRGCRGCRVSLQRRRGARVRLGSLSSGSAVMGGGAWSCQTQPWPLEALSGLICRLHGGGPAAPPSSSCDVVLEALLGG